MTPAEVRAGLASALSTIPNLAVSQYRTGNIQAPHAVITSASITYDFTFGRGADSYAMQVLIYVTRADDPDGAMLLDQFLAGHGDRSVRTILCDPTAHGLVDANGNAVAVRVLRAEMGTTSSPDGAEYLAATFDVELTVSGVS